MRWRRFARRIDAPSSRANACEFDGTTGRKSPGAEAESAGSERSWTSIAELSCEGVPVEHLAEAQSCVRRGDHAVTRRGLLSTLTPRHLSFTGDSMDGSMGVRARTKGTVRVDRSTRRLFNAFIPAFIRLIESRVFLYSSRTSCLANISFAHALHIVFLSSSGTRVNMTSSTRSSSPRSPT